MQQHSKGVELHLAFPHLLEVSCGVLQRYYMPNHFAQVMLGDSCLDGLLNGNNRSLCDVQLHEYVMVRDVGDDSATGMSNGGQLRMEHSADTAYPTALDAHGLGCEYGHSQVVVVEVEGAHSFPSNHTILKILASKQLLSNNGKL